MRGSLLFMKRDGCWMWSPNLAEPPPATRALAPVTGGMIRFLKPKKDSCVLRCISCVVIVVLSSSGHSQRITPVPAVRATSSRIQEGDEKSRRPQSPRAISAATIEFQKAVNGKASVRNHCLVQSNESDIEEKSEVIETNHCQLVVRTTKTTRSAVTSNEGSPGAQQSIEFSIHADLSKLTIPVLVEPQKFAQCDAGAGVLKVSSRSDPKEPMRVIRRTQGASPEADEKLTRKDLSLFFADPKAAKTAAGALERAVRACGGKEWPDEDDLP